MPAHRRLIGWSLLLLVVAAGVAIARPAHAFPFTVPFTAAEDEDCVAWTVLRPKTPADPATRICTTRTAPPPVVTPAPEQPTGAISCAGFGTTKVIDAVVPANGATFVRYYTTTRGVFRNSSAIGLQGNEALVVAFKAPATVDPIFQLGVTHTGDSNGPQATRTFTLSTKPCDFAYPASPDALWASQSTVAALKLASGAPSAYARLALEPGRTYYVNMMSRAGAQVCTGRCDVYVSILNNTP